MGWTEVVDVGKGRFEAMSVSWPVKLGIALLLSVIEQIQVYYSSAPELLRISAGLAAMLLVLDTFTGVVCARVVRKERITSFGLRRMALKGVVYGGLWALGLALDLGLRLGHGAQTAVLVYTSATEGLSCFENLSAIGSYIGVKPPSFLKQMLSEWQKQSDQGVDHETRD